MFGTCRALLAAVGVLLVGGLASSAPVAAQQPTTVTGCLSKGLGKETFDLKSSDGRTYSLTSTNVKLSQHVGHRVTVTGTSAGIETGALKDTSKKIDTSMKKAAGAPLGGGGLTVTSLKMVSTQCK